MWQTAGLAALWVVPLLAWPIFWAGRLGWAGHAHACSHGRVANCPRSQPSVVVAIVVAAPPRSAADLALTYAVDELLIGRTRPGNAQGTSRTHPAERVTFGRNPLRCI